MKNKNHLHPFIHSMFLRNSINAAVARNPIYINNATQVQKRSFRESCKQRLVELGVRYYVWEWNLESYAYEITSFSDSISHSHGQLLTIGRLNIGTSQKMVSLYLKYLWLDGDSSKKPTGAVLDRGILVESGYPNPPDWTKLDDINVYRDIQLAISEKASSQGYGSAAVWEAEKWGSEENETS